MTRPNYLIAAIGEVLWDVFPDGPRFGGAPANFACTLSGLCRDRVRVHMVSSVGNDDLGSRALASLEKHEVDTTWVKTLDFATGKVQIQLNDQGVASYEFAENTAWDNLASTDELLSFVAGTDAICFGTLGQRNDVSKNTIQRAVSATKPESLRIFDVNLRPPFFTDQVILDSLEIANVLKLNDDELPMLAKLSNLEGTEVELMQQLAKRYALRAVALTRGANGAVIVRGDEISSHPGVDTTLVDTVGAGDAFTAALTIGLLDSCELDLINSRACEVAAFVCSQPGATPQIPETLADKFM